MGAGSGAQACGPQLSRRWDRFLGRAVSPSALLFSATHRPKEQRAGFGDTAPRRKPGQRSMAPRGSAPGVAVAGPEGTPSAGEGVAGSQPTRTCPSSVLPTPLSLGRLRSPQALWG